MWKIKMLGILALGAVVGLSALAYVQIASVQASPLKPHHTINDVTHVTGKPDFNVCPGGVHLPIFYNDVNNNNVHDHGPRIEALIAKECAPP